MAKGFWLAAACGVALTCAPAMAAPPQGMSAAEKARGAEQHQSLVRDYGGAMTGPAADFVTRVGRRVAVQSGLSQTGDDFVVTLLDSSVVNAFATQGGYIYATRGLLAMMRDEAELAGVLGHEVGHVAKRHGQARQRRHIFSNIVVAAVFATGGSALANLADRQAFLLGQGFSRADEYESDDLGQQYMAAAGYDPEGAVGMLEMLERNRQFSGNFTGVGTAPEAKEMSHPDNSDRIARARARLAGTGLSGKGQRDRDTYLAAVDGLPYGPSTTYGVVDRGEFKWPFQRLAMTLPTRQTVSIAEGKLVLTGEGASATFSEEWSDSQKPSVIVDQLFKRFGDIKHFPVQTGVVNGFDIGFAPGRIDGVDGQLGIDIDIVVYATRTAPIRTYSLITMTAEGTGLGPYVRMVESVRQIPEGEAIDRRPIRVKVVEVKAGDSIASLAGSMAVDDRAIEQFLLINGMEATSVLRQGDKVKLLMR